MPYGLLPDGASPIVPDLASLSLAGTNATLALLLLQLLIIIALCTALGHAFQAAGQPRVAGELLAGVCLGPTVLGNIPGFTENILPSEAKGMLTLMSNIGLVWFLLLVGLETDTDLIAKYAKEVALVALPGMAVPFGVSAGLAKLLYDIETDGSVQFSTFFLFVGTTMAVTSLSVLSRVLAELRLLSTTLGSVAIAAGACNDTIGYILLALASALAGGGKQINALYQLLVGLALALVLWFAVRPLVFLWIRHSTFDLHGPTHGPENRVPTGMLVFVLVGSLASSFVTVIAGLHPILGALLFGICVPHGALAVRVTESIETITVGVLLPLYFALAAGSVNLKLLDNGTTWGLTILLVVCTFVSKFASTTLATKVAGFTWRESMFVASLMQSKGIIELVILNVGLGLGVISDRVYAMLFVSFICTTLLVRPLSRFIYLSGGRHAGAEGDDDEGSINEKMRDEPSIALPRPADFPIVAAVTSPSAAVESLLGLVGVLGCAAQDGQALVTLDLVRLLPTEHTTANILRQVLAADTQHGDQMLDALKHCAELQGVHTSSSLSAQRRIAHETQHERPTYAIKDVFTVANNEMLPTLTRSLERAHARLGLDAEVTSELGRGLTLMSWAGRGLDEEGSRAQAEANHLPVRMLRDMHNACGVLLGSHRLGAHISREVRAAAEDVLAMPASQQPRIVVAFFGGRDDRAAVQLARRMAAAGRAQAVVVHMRSGEDPADEVGAEPPQAPQAPHAEAALAEDFEHDTVNLRTVYQAAAQRQDVRFLFAQGAPEAPAQPCDVPDRPLTHSTDGLTFVTLPASPCVVRDTLAFAAPLLDQSRGDLLLVGHGKLAQRTRAFREETDALVLAAPRTEQRGELRRIGRALGAATEAALAAGVRTHVLVVQARRE